MRLCAGELLVNVYIFIPFTIIGHSVPARFPNSAYQRPVGAVSHRTASAQLETAPTKRGTGQRRWKQRLPNMGNESVYLFLEFTIIDLPMPSNRESEQQHGIS